MNTEMFIEEEDEIGEVLNINSGTVKRLTEATIDVNPLTGERIELNPLEKIKYAAERFGMALNDVDPKCKKCYGRGYKGIESKTQTPIPCQCIIPKKMRDAMDNQFIPQNRKTRRMSEQFAKKNSKK